VVFQAAYDDRRFGGVNPYALGFAMMHDIKRICLEPTEEDRTWFPEIAGNGDWSGVLKEAWANYRDESFVRQFLSPKLIRDFKLFLLTDDENDDHVVIDEIHNEQGYEKVRNALALGYDVTATAPDIQVADVDLRGDRELVLKHTIRDDVPLADGSRKDVLAYVRALWGYDVRLEGIEQDTGKTAYTDQTAQEKAESAD
jgi:spore cortex formation protein SpoVR/YcgB (stage V sporulation)